MSAPSNAPNPTQAPPPAAATAVPGPRASRLQQVFDQALARTLRANSYANFAGCFPTPARYVPTSLESVWRQLNTKLEESARAEFEDIIRERDAVGQLNELDRLVGEARGRKEEEEEGESGGEGVVVYVVLFLGDGGRGGGANCCPCRPHTLAPEELYRAHLTPYLREAKEGIDAKVGDTQAQNEGLAREVQAQRLKIQSLLAGLEDVVKDLEGAANATTRFSAGNDLHQENIQMDEEIRARPVI